MKLNLILAGCDFSYLTCHIGRIYQRQLLSVFGYDVAMGDIEERVWLSLF
jgi:hypothetical protein